MGNEFGVKSSVFGERLLNNQLSKIFELKMVGPYKLPKNLLISGIMGS